MKWDSRFYLSEWMLTIHWEQIKEVLGDKVQRVNAAFSLPSAAVLIEMAKKLGTNGSAYRPFRSTYA